MAQRIFFLRSPDESVDPSACDALAEFFLDQDPPFRPDLIIADPDPFVMEWIEKLLMQYGHGATALQTAPELGDWKEAHILREFIPDLSKLAEQHHVDVTEVLLTLVPAHARIRQGFHALMARALRKVIQQISAVEGDLLVVAGELTIDVVTRLVRINPTDADLNELRFRYTVLDGFVQDPVRYQPGEGALLTCSHGKGVTNFVTYPNPRDSDVIMHL